MAVKVAASAAVRGLEQRFPRLPEIAARGDRALGSELAAQSFARNVRHCC